MNHTRNKLFTVEEANRLVPYLEGTLVTLGELGARATRAHRDIAVLQAIASSGASEANADVRALREKEAVFAETIERFRSLLNDVAKRGCVLRDLDLGLVDFYSVSRGRVVCLCWRRGEERVGHWHPVDQGFSGRRPIEELD